MNGQAGLFSLFLGAEHFTDLCVKVLEYTLRTDFVQHRNDHLDLRIGQIIVLGNVAELVGNDLVADHGCLFAFLDHTSDNAA